MQQPPPAGQSSAALVLEHETCAAPSPPPSSHVPKAPLPSHLLSHLPAAVTQHAHFNGQPPSPSYSAHHHQQRFHHPHHAPPGSGGPALSPASPAGTNGAQDLTRPQLLVVLSLCFLLLTSVSYIAFAVFGVRLSSPGLFKHGLGVWNVFSLSRRQKARQHRKTVERIRAASTAALAASAAAAASDSHHRAASVGGDRRTRSTSPSKRNISPSRREHLLVVPPKPGVPAVSLTAAGELSPPHSAASSSAGSNGSTEDACIGTTATGKHQPLARRRSRRGSAAPTPVLERDRPGDREKPTTREQATQVSDVEEQEVTSFTTAMESRGRKRARETTEAAVQTSPRPSPPPPAVERRPTLVLDTSDATVRSGVPVPAPALLPVAPQPECATCAGRDRSLSLASSIASTSVSVTSGTSSLRSGTDSPSGDPASLTLCAPRPLRGLALEIAGDTSSSSEAAQSREASLGRSVVSIDAAVSVAQVDASSTSSGSGMSVGTTSSSRRDSEASMSTAATSETSWSRRKAAAASAAGKKAAVPPVPPLPGQPGRGNSLGGTSATTVPGRLVPGLDRRPSVGTDEGRQRSRGRRGKNKGKAAQDPSSSDTAPAADKGVGTAEEFYWTMDPFDEEMEEEDSPRERQETVAPSPPDEQFERLRRWSRTASGLAPEDLMAHSQPQPPSLLVPTRGAHVNLAQPQPPSRSPSPSPVMMAQPLPVPHPGYYSTPPSHPQPLPYPAAIPYGAYYVPPVSSPYAAGGEPRPHSLSRRGSFIAQQPHLLSPQPQLAPGYYPAAGWTPMPFHASSSPGSCDATPMGAHASPYAAANGYFPYPVMYPHAPMSRSASPQPSPNTVVPSGGRSPESGRRASNELVRMKEVMDAMRRSVRKMETQKERMRKELEYVKWSLRCRDQDDAETQKSLSYFAQRAARAEARVKLMEELRSQAHLDEGSSPDVPLAGPSTIHSSPAASDDGRLEVAPRYHSLPATPAPDAKGFPSVPPPPLPPLPRRWKGKGRRSDPYPPEPLDDFDDSDFSVEFILSTGAETAVVSQRRFGKVPSRQGSRNEDDLIGSWSFDPASVLRTAGDADDGDPEDVSDVDVANLQQIGMVGTLPASRFVGVCAEALCDSDEPGGGDDCDDRAEE